MKSTSNIGVGGVCPRFPGFIQINSGGSDSIHCRSFLARCTQTGRTSSHYIGDAIIRSVLDQTDRMWRTLTLRWRQVAHAFVRRVPTMMDAPLMSMRRTLRRTEICSPRKISYCCLYGDLPLPCQPFEFCPGSSLQSPVRPHTPCNDGAPHGAMPCHCGSRHDIACRPLAGSPRLTGFIPHGVDSQFRLSGSGQEG